MMNQTSVSFFLYTVFLEDNYLLYEAGDGIEALSLLKRNKVDAALVDLQMPEMDGLGLLGELKKSLSGNHGDYAHRPGRQRRCCESYQTWCC
jgi:CheY-like chemotaxis protein